MCNCLKISTENFMARFLFTFLVIKSFIDFFTDFRALGFLVVVIYLVSVEIIYFGIYRKPIKLSLSLLLVGFYVVLNILIGGSFIFNLKIFSSIFNNARSESGSAPTNSASYSRRSVNRITISSAPFTTW